MSMYLNAGVDINATQQLIKKLQSRFPHIGGFGGLYPWGEQYLVAGADGVGTKLKIATQLKQYDTIGIDLVAMCVNDIITTGAKPLFFLDYFATSYFDLEQATKILDGIIKGCELSSCLLLGGETAQMPGLYQPGDFDMCGFAVGAVDKDKLIDGKGIVPGDALVGLASSGLHSNGFSLVRKLIDDHAIDLGCTQNGTGLTLGDALLTPTRIYCKDVATLIQHHPIKGISHITGGGFDNISRMLPQGLKPLIDRQAWEVPPLFHYIQALGSIAEDEMYRTFNMGVGLVMAMENTAAEKLCQNHPECIMIGKVDTL